MPTHTALGRSAGLTAPQVAHLHDDPLPDGVYRDDEAAIVRYARQATAMAPIDDDLYADLRRHLSEQQVIELCFTVGVSNIINRFHATFHTPVDETTLEELRRLDG